MTKSREKNATREYSSNTPQVFTISLARLAAILAGAIITSIVGTAFTIGGSGISDHFLLVSVRADVDNLKDTTVKQEVYKTDIEYIKSTLTDIRQDLKDLRNDGTLSKR